LPWAMVCFPFLRWGPAVRTGSKAGVVTS
jgi:hypothetical protein